MNAPKEEQEMNIFIGLSLIAFLLSPSFGLAEVKVFEKEVEEIVGRDQSQEQVEAFALQKAKRLAIEEAGTYISSLTVVQNFRLVKDEITALASGVTQSQVLGVPAVVLKNGVIHVTVKARITVDTSILDQQIKEIMKEKGTLKKLEDAQQKVRELEDRLANLKSSEVKRLEDLNAQALALERERERQRLVLDEQVLKAQGELKKAELERLQKERQMQERISKTITEQERARKEEAEALAREQDRIRRASLENEQRWNELSRKAKLSQESWVVIDDSLSLKQALTEVTDLKREIANLKSRLDYQYTENTKNLTAAYAQQRALTTAKLPPRPAPKDAFESTKEYNERIATYERQVKNAQNEGADSVETLKKEENLKLADAKADYLGQQIRVLTPFIERLQDLQDRKFTLPEGGGMTLELGEPDADNNRFPLRLQHNGKMWSTWWDYTDRNSAKDFYRTRTYLKAQGLFQIEEVEKLSPKLTAALVTHPGTKETREFRLETPKIFAEIAQFGKLQEEETTAKQTSKKAAFLLTHKEVGGDGRFFAYDDGTVLDRRTNLMWAAKDNGSDINWRRAKIYCENYRGGGYTDWRMPTLKELAELFDRSVSGHNGVHLTRQITLTRGYLLALETRGSDVAMFDFFGDGILNWVSQYHAYFRALPVRSHK
jgi:hypothetical protein